MKRILVVGDPIIDRHWYCTPKGVSPEAPILTWDVDQIVDKPGGAANVVNNLCGLKEASKQEVEITFISVVPPEILSCLPEKFPKSNLIITDRKPTIKNRIIFKNPHQQITRFDEDNNNDLTGSEIFRVISQISKRRFDIGLVSDYSHGGASTSIINAVRKSCNLVICDPKGTDSSKYAGVIDILTPNLKELNDLSPGEFSSGCITKLFNLTRCLENNDGREVSIILKQGEKGCCLYNSWKDIQLYSAYRTERPVLDPTGAGDTFIATLAFRLAVGDSIYEATEEANMLAGISVTYPNCWVPGE